MTREHIYALHEKKKKIYDKNVPRKYVHAKKKVIGSTKCHLFILHVVIFEWKDLASKNIFCLTRENIYASMKNNFYGRNAPRKYVHAK